MTDARDTTRGAGLAAVKPTGWKKLIPNWVRAHWTTIAGVAGGVLGGWLFFGGSKAIDVSLPIVTKEVPSSPTTDWKKIGAGVAAGALTGALGYKTLGTTVPETKVESPEDKKVKRAISRVRRVAPKGWRCWVLNNLWAVLASIAVVFLLIGCCLYRILSAITVKQKHAVEVQRKDSAVELEEGLNGYSG